VNKWNSTRLLYVAWIDKKLFVDRFGEFHMILTVRSFNHTSISQVDFFFGLVLLKIKKSIENFSTAITIRQFKHVKNTKELTLHYKSSKLN